VLLNPDRPPGAVAAVSAAVTGFGAVEEARAALADDVNLTHRLVVERAFLSVASTAFDAA
jgi:hypothetical protein